MARFALPCCRSATASLIATIAEAQAASTALAGPVSPSTNETRPAVPFRFVPLSAYRHAAASAGFAESTTSMRYSSLLIPE